MQVTPAHAATLCVAALAIAGVILRPWRLPEAIWAVLGAATLTVFSLISVSGALSAIRKGTDVYLFLTGMMVLAEFARHEGLFDWLAAYAVRRSKGSAKTLFLLVYGVGTLVTVFLSNDATAVVLTPAVYAVAKQARAEPLPYLFICAFIANAASFALPISNPANLVVFETHMPSLGKWLSQFGIASLVSILVTYVVLRFTQRSALTGHIKSEVALPALTAGGRLVATGIAMTAILLLIASSSDWQLGLPTFLAGMTTGIVILLRGRAAPWPVIRAISWSVLPLVAGLFVLVEGVERTGILAPLGQFIASQAERAPGSTALVAGAIAASVCNLVNNLPLGLIAGTLATGSHLSAPVAGAMLIGVDLGPNLSVTGSLATILWLVALRRESQEVSAWKFLALGSLVMPPALLASLLILILNAIAFR
jgi:arsenical pump membrane protein